MSSSKRKEHKARNCIFCDWKMFSKEKHRLLYGDEKTSYYVVLDRSPKILGHVLVIAKNPYDDITDLEPNSEETIQIMSGVVKWVRRMKARLPGVEKVYVMTMCEHWKPKEIRENWQPNDPHPSTTEHLHFHLIPRYKDKRTKAEAMENLFSRLGDEKWPEKALEVVKRLLMEG